MNALYIEGTDDTPRVVLDPEKGIFEFIGNSYPENSTKFYTAVLEWLKSFSEAKLPGQLVFSFTFDYFNTSSAKYILEIIRFIHISRQGGNDCTIRWYYFEDDTDMLESGEDYQMTVDVPFELIMREDTF